MNKFQELKARQAELDKQVQEESKVYFQEIIGTIFFKYPQIETIGWRQYTPYFNDGDECHFSVHDAEINGEDKWSSRGNGIPEQAFDEIRDVLNEIGDEMLKKSFGDHVKITCTRKGISIDEYEHD